MNSSSHRKRCTTTALRIERLEDRRVLAGAGFELPLTPPVAPHGEDLSNLASQVVQQVQSRAAALAGQVAAIAPRTFPDVDGKDGVTSLDALLVINDLNRYGTRLLQSHDLAERCFDVDQDDWVTPFDALTVVNQVNYQLRQLNSAAAATQISVLDELPQQDESAELITKVYPVGDLVIPRQGPLSGLGDGFVGGLLNGLADKLRSGFGGGMGGGDMEGGDMEGGGMGGGGMGGGSIADYDALIDLIKHTVAPDSWDQLGGDGTIQTLPQNLRLVVNQTPPVHEQVADLLNQLRRLQDLQITIEVRFVTLNDNFFERIGVDFDFDIDDQTLPLPGEQAFADGAPGVNQLGGFTQSFGRRAVPDLTFEQNSFVIPPAFGGGQVDAGANFGFAILSDIEVFFLLQASQDDDRTDVLEAPKVTLFNGQTATVISDTQLPFVTSVVPVVG